MSGSCTDLAGNVATASLALKYDSTPPTAAAAADRVPDTNGWYNHALTVSFSGTDATAGIAGCSSAAYAGPDSDGATAVGLLHRQRRQRRHGEPALQVRRHAAGSYG